MYSDTGVIFDDSKKAEFISFGYEKTNTVHINKRDILIETAIYLDKNTPTFRRQYIKLSDVAAKVGGVFSLIIPLLEFFIRIFIDNEYAVYLYYSLFKIKQ